MNRIKQTLRHYAHPLHVACRLRDVLNFLGRDCDFRNLVGRLTWYEIKIYNRLLG